jgi:putative transposase
MSDNGSQPTSRSFMETCAGLEIKQAFTAYNNPKGNAGTERMMRAPQRRTLLPARMTIGSRVKNGARQIRRTLQ